MIFCITKINDEYIRFFTASMNKNDIANAMFAMIIKSEYENITYSSKNPSDLLKKLNETLILNKKDMDIFAHAMSIDVDIQNKSIIYSSSDFSIQYALIGDSIIEMIATQKDMLGVSISQSFIDTSLSLGSKTKIVLINQNTSDFIDYEVILNLLSKNINKNIVEIMDILEMYLKTLPMYETINIYPLGININDSRSIDKNDGSL